MVDAFSAPKSLIAQAKREAAKRGMTKTGFYRYCLAKECGFSERDAASFSLHRGVTNSISGAVLNESSGPNSGVQIVQMGKKNLSNPYPKFRAKKKQPKL